MLINDLPNSLPPGHSAIDLYSFQLGCYSMAILPKKPHFLSTFQVPGDALLYPSTATLPGDTNHLHD